MNGSHKYAHRVAWELENGPIPDGLLIDHICFNPLCVRVSHLRLVTPKLNNEYQHRGRRKVPESGVRGVYRNRDKWIARVKHYGKVHNIGSFASQDDAAAAVTKLRHELFTYPEYQEA